MFSPCNSNLIQLEFLVRCSKLPEVSDFFPKFESRAWLWSFIRWVYGNFFSNTSRFSALAILFIFFKVDKDINKHDLYSSEGHRAHKGYICNNSEETRSEVKGYSRCKGIDNEEKSDEFMDTTLFEFSIKRKMKMLSEPNGFFLYVELDVDFLSNSQQLYTNFEVRLPPIRTRLT